MHQEIFFLYLLLQCPRAVRYQVIQELFEEEHDVLRMQMKRLQIKIDIFLTHHSLAKFLYKPMATITVFKKYVDGITNPFLEFSPTVPINFRTKR